MEDFCTAVLKNTVLNGDGLGGGFGAVEVAVRYDHIDLDRVEALFAGATVPPTVIGTHRNWTVGLNWYLNEPARLMFNWVNTDTDYTFIGNSTSNNFGVRYEVSFDITQ